ncbi:MAG: exodeoxyribonuclease VII large subunit [Muribaculaceae bacterium]|nr:exodeoxyribonuclease VII large subunit [Muribaculaceae bacterium]
MITLRGLMSVVGRLVQGRPETSGVWVTAELADVAVRGGHCYMELLEKDDGGRQVARIRGCVWANVYARLAPYFYQATGQQFASGLKVMLRGSVSMHPVFGMSFVVDSVNPEFTMGDLLRRRREILRRLKEEGILEMNKELRWPAVPQRIAVVSSPGAAGYGDFINQLEGNPSRLRFFTRLYEATMQGASAPASIVAALDRVAADRDLWDGVVIIRGGGATADLQAFEDYSLAAAVAQFPLPVAIGIGHERDVTVLDYIANMRLKTPTAVAEWLIGRGEEMLGFLTMAGQRILQLATDRLSGHRQQLAQAEALLPAASRNAVERAAGRLRSAASMLSGISGRRVQSQLSRLDMVYETVGRSGREALRRQAEWLAARGELLEVLSPMATLRRGYSISRVGGRAVSSVAEVPPGTAVETTLADGTFVSTTE